LRLKAKTPSMMMVKGCPQQNEGMKQWRKKPARRDERDWGHCAPMNECNEAMTMGKKRGEEENKVLFPVEGKAPLEAGKGKLDLKSKAMNVQKNQRKSTEGERIVGGRKTEPRKSKRKSVKDRAVTRNM